MKVLITRAGISKKGNHYAQGLIWSDKANAWCQVSDGHGGYQNSFVPLSEEKYNEVVGDIENGCIIEVERHVDVF